MMLSGNVRSSRACVVLACCLWLCNRFKRVLNVAVDSVLWCALALISVMLLWPMFCKVVGKALLQSPFL